MKFFIVFAASFLFASYSIQVVSGKYINTSLKAFSKLKNYPCVRIEYINGFYVVRVGLSENKNSLFLLLERVKSLFKDSFILEVNFDKNRIIISKNCNIKKSIFKILKNKFHLNLKPNKIKVSKLSKDKSIKFPTFIEYSIANIKNNKYKLEKLLKNNSKDIFYRDKVEGYIKIGKVGKAFYQIFNNLDKASLDYLSYKQAINFMTYLENLSTSFYYESSRDYNKNYFGIKYHTKNFLFNIYRERFINYFKVYGGELKYKSYFLSFYRDFFGIGYFKKKDLDRFKFLCEVGLNKRSDESIDLQKHGKKHFFNFKTYVNLKKNEELIFNFRYNYYLYLHSFLGDSKNLSFEYKKVLRQGYPNFNYYFLVSYFLYNQTSFLNKDILPTNSLSFKVGINLGDRDLNFNNRILPFFKFFVDYDLFKKILGYDAFIGFKGRLFRKDYFLFGIDLYKNLYDYYLCKFILSYKYYF